MDAIDAVAAHYFGGAMEWVDDGACVEYEEHAAWWFPDRGAQGHQFSAQARAVCGRCLVQLDCLAYALANEITEGIWGGMTPNQRKKLAR